MLALTHDGSGGALERFQERSRACNTCHNSSPMWVLHCRERNEHKSSLNNWHIFFNFRHIDFWCCWIFHLLFFSCTLSVSLTNFFLSKLYHPPFRMKSIALMAACLLGCSNVVSVTGENMNCEGGYCTNDVETTLRSLRNDLWWLMEKHNCNPLMIRLAFHVCTDSFVYS